MSFSSILASAHSWVKHGFTVWIELNNNLQSLLHFYYNVQLTQVKEHNVYAVRFRWTGGFGWLNPAEAAGDHIIEVHACHTCSIFLLIQGHLDVLHQQLPVVGTGGFWGVSYGVMDFLLEKLKTLETISKKPQLTDVL